MRAVILAAGEGMRMRPLTEDLPKPMLEILGRPLLHHILNELPDEIDEVVLVVGYLNEKIREYFGEQFGRLKISYVFQTEKLGTAYALGLCRDFLDNTRFLMMYADDLQLKSDIRKCLDYPLSILVKEVEDPRRFGVVVTDKQDYLLDLVEKPESHISNLVSTGVMVLDDRIFHYPASKHKNGEYYLTSSLAQFAKNQQIKGVRASFWLPIGHPEDLKKAEDVLRRKQNAQKIY